MVALKIIFLLCCFFFVATKAAEDEESLAYYATTFAPSFAPTKAPSRSPTRLPSQIPTVTPSSPPTSVPTDMPVKSPRANSNLFISNSILTSSQEVIVIGVASAVGFLLVAFFAYRIVLSRNQAPKPFVDEPKASTYSSPLLSA